VQRIVKVRRDYNRWVADETLEDYALRYAPKGFRKWSEARVAHTAFGGVSFLALEAIGATLALNYGFMNAVWAIAAVSLLIFLTGLPIAYRAAREGLDMDLLSRGTGFGYLGATLTSLIYASFTFIFFAIEAAIMAQGLELWFGLPRMAGYVVSALIVIPVVVHGVTAISRLQVWTQPLWLALLVLPFLAIALHNPGAFIGFTQLEGRYTDGPGFSWIAFGAAAAVAASLIAQIGEQVDFLRFMPEATRRNRVRWWAAVIIAGPGWIVLGALKMLAGAFLAFLALQHAVDPEKVFEPTQLYLVGFGYVVGSGSLAVALTGLFVVVSQVKINVTNAYAGSLAWSNFFARLTHSHPGRVVWLVFNVAIALLLMMLGVFEALEKVLGFYAHLALAWVGAIVGDLVLSKPLGLSPARIEFRRAYLHDVNPVGVGAMAAGSVLSVAAYAGAFGPNVGAGSTFIAIGVACAAAPLLAWLTRGRWFEARTPVDFGARHRTLRCAVCRNRYESEDMAACPAYGGAICSLCCSLDARCGDRCKPDAPPGARLGGLLTRLLPGHAQPGTLARIGRFAAVMSVALAVFAALLWLLFTQAALTLESGRAFNASQLQSLFGKLAVGLTMLTGVAAWWLVLTDESRHVAQQESERQNQLLQREVDARRETDTQLAAAKEVAEGANLAKSRFLTGMSHEMRSPLNTILGYSQLMLRDPALKPTQRDALDTILRSGEHLTGLVDGLLELSRIEHGRVRIESRPVELPDLLSQVDRMFRPLAEEKGLAFHYEAEGALPTWVNVDAKRLRQILINLLSNAVKFTERGSVTLRIRHTREMGHIEVIDTGVGIAQEDTERIFRPFERLRPGGVEGTGLGLTVTQLLVGLLGGEIQVHSEPGRGSRFQLSVYLPVVSRPVDEKLEQTQAQASGYVGPRRSVLIVDDEAAHRTVLAQLLSGLGFEVRQAESGAQCLAELDRAPADLVLLDVNLPDERGWSVCRRIRERPGPRIGVLMVSGSVGEHNETDRISAGADGFVPKPVIQSELLNAIRQCLNLRWEGLATEPPAERADAAPPSAQVVRELLALAAGGYPKALRARLAELSQESAASAAWVAHLAPLVETDAPSLKALLVETLRDTRHE
jgi:signal transduction histidine kinase/DNA-binding NarL/FixJ family response regulator